LWVAERAPDWVEEPGGFIGGITMATTAADIARAIREATFRQLGRIIEQLPGKLRFVVSGGLSRNGADMQLLADVLGRPVSACAEPEASLRGAAVFALEKLGAKLKPLPSGKTYRPQGRSVAPIK
jgi:gluconokinase